MEKLLNKYLHFGWLFVMVWANIFLHIDCMRLFWFIFFSIIICIIVGTLSHEACHGITAKMYGSKHVHLSFAYTKFSHNGLPYYEKRQAIYDTYREAILNNTPFPEEDIYKTYTSQYSFALFVITCAGPAQTMLVGTIGLLMLLILGKQLKNGETLSTKGWLWVFASLFWCRQVANMVIALTSSYFIGKFPPFGDEARMASYLNLPIYAINLLTGFIGVIALEWVIFHFLPTTQRKIFLIASLLGGVVGYLFWFEWVGKYVLPL
jgi:hypothetical protein